VKLIRLDEQDSIADVTVVATSSEVDAEIGDVAEETSEKE
jgi:hypothetical protein